MRIGVNLPQYEIDVTDGSALARRMIMLARTAEAHGLDAVWVSDHPFAIAPDGTASGSLDAFVAMGAVASATRVVEVGSLVLAASMRGADSIGRADRALDAIAPGRATIGVGAGWYRPEHDAYGVTFPRLPERQNELRRAAEAVRRGRLLVGGSGDAVLSVAAAQAHVWNMAWDPPLDAFRARSAALDTACGRRGRDPREIARSVGLTILLGSEARSLEAALASVRSRAPFLARLELAALRGHIVMGAPDDCARQIAAYGADEVVLTPLLRDDEESIVRIATEVAPLLRRSVSR